MNSGVPARCSYSLNILNSSKIVAQNLAMNIFQRLKRNHVHYTLKKHRIAYPLWRQTTEKLPLLNHLNSREKAQLRILSSLFLHKKTMTGVQGVTVTDEIAILVATQACLPVLKLGLDYYRGWIEVIIYPAAFQVTHENIDENGLSSNDTLNLSGESWLRGPVILSWEDVEADLEMLHQGRNVIIHEFAHKIDMLNGRANGMPPLHPQMTPHKWTNALSEAYEKLRNQISHHHRAAINPYAATAPAEFFAVVSEYFFTAPKLLQQYCPDVHTQLVQFYRQDPCLCRPNVCSTN